MTIWTWKKIAAEYDKGVSVNDIMAKSGKSYTDVQRAIQKFAKKRGGVSPAAINHIKKGNK